MSVLFTASAWGQTADHLPGAIELSLEQAVERAARESEEVQLARSRVNLAVTQVRQAWSNLMPQVNAVAGYTRTLASIFDTGTSFSLPDSMRFEPDPNIPVEDRLRYLEQRTPMAAFGALGQLFGDLPFGRENVYLVNLSGSQVLYDGGRIGGAIRIARHAGEAAQYGLGEELADVELNVRQAYYQALFARELVSISEAAVERAQRFYDEEQLRMRAGRASDLDVMRAEVELENLRPQLVQAHNAAELAELNLKRLVNIPLEQPITLTSQLEPPQAAPARVERADLQAVIASRGAVQALKEQVAIRNRQISIARSAYLPAFVLTTSYGKQLFPSSLLALDEDWRTDWTVGISMQVPLFDGFRRSAQVQQAHVERQQAELQLNQLTEAIQLQFEQASGERERAMVQVEAGQRTVDQADRVYSLTQMRYEKGLATQLEVFNAQLALLQARTNLAQAITGFYLAEASLNRVMGRSTYR